LHSRFQEFLCRIRQMPRGLERAGEKAVSRPKPIKRKGKLPEGKKEGNPTHALSENLKLLWPEYLGRWRGDSEKGTRKNLRHLQLTQKKKKMEAKDIFPAKQCGDQKTQGGGTEESAVEGGDHGGAKVALPARIAKKASKRKWRER